MGLRRLLKRIFKPSQNQKAETLPQDDGTCVSQVAESLLQDDATRVSQVDHGSIVTTAAVPISDHDVWALAYKAIGKREPGLMAGFGAHLTFLQPGSAPGADFTSPRSVKLLVDNLLESREKGQWRITIQHKEIKIREQVEKIAKFLQWAEPVVKSAVSTQPYIALAWSGATLLLPLITQSTEQLTAMLKGLASISHVQTSWYLHAGRYLNSPHQQSDSDLVEPLTELYSHIIEYHARVICHLSKAQMSRAWQEVAGWNDWEAKAGEIRELSDRCSDRISHLKELEILGHWDLLQQTMNKLCGIQEESRDARKEQVIDENERRLLHDLAQGAGDYEATKNSIPKKVPGTCEWFLADERFCKWREEKDSGVLWVSAGPGCGKSVLSRTLVDEEQLTSSSTTITRTSSANTASTTITATTTIVKACYFFFRDGGAGFMDGAQALCALLHQIFTQDSTGKPTSYALASHKNFGENLTRNFSELWRILLDYTKTSGVDIVFIIDALDESKKEGRHEIVGKLEEYSSNPAPGMKFLVTSRPYDEFEISFARFPTTGYVRLDGNDKAEHIRREIDLVIDFKTTVIAHGFSQENRLKIADRLKSKENRTYLWLHLTLNIIESRRSSYSRAGDIEKLLSELPAEVNEAYEKILSRSPNEERAGTLLKILLAAERPLNLDEANIAFTSALKETPFSSHLALDSELWTRENFRLLVIGLCGLFVTIYDSKLFFIHQTAREFLTDNRRGVWQGRFSISASHTTMALVCTRYLLLPDIDSCSFQHERPFLTYAARAWSRHFVSQEEISVDLTRKEARALCRCAPIEYQNTGWIAASHRLYQYNLPEKDWTDLGFATYLGLKVVVDDILCEADTDINAATLSYGSALTTAMALGHIDIFQTLLDKGADVNIFGSINGSALLATARRGHMDIMEKLLEMGANDSDQKHNYGTILHVASERGHRDIVEKRLKDGVDVNARGGWYETALQAASSEGHCEVVRELLKAGADVDVLGGYYGSALFAAVYKGREDVVRELVRNGADINKPVYCPRWIIDGYYSLQNSTQSDNVAAYGTKNALCTALQVASMSDCATIIEILISLGAVVNQECGEVGTALQAASMSGCLEPVKTLLKKGADVSKSGGSYGTALFAASKGGHAQIVDLLLEHGADIHQLSGGTESERDRTALEVAMEEERDEICEKLRAKGAQPC